MNNGYEQGYEQVMNNPSDLKRHSPLIPPIEKERERDKERNNDVKSSDPVPRTPAHAREGTGTGAGTAPEPQTGSGSDAFRQFSGSGAVPERRRRRIPITKALILYGEVGDGRIMDPVQTALLVLNVPPVTVDAYGVTFNNARIWRSVLLVIGERAFRDALYRQYRENDIDGNPRSRAATFQAKLNALKYGKGRAQ